MSIVIEEAVQNVSPLEFRELITSRRRLVRKLDPQTLDMVLFDPDTGETFATDFAALDKLLLATQTS